MTTVNAAAGEQMKVRAWDVGKSEGRPPGLLGGGGSKARAMISAEEKVLPRRNQGAP